MSAAQRVIDEIDALVEEQLRGGEPETGCDFDDPDFPECRCGLDWHGLSTLICPGSDTEGPLQLPGLTFGRWPEMPRRTPDGTLGDVALLGEIHQWPRPAVEEAWGALTQAARQMWQQFAESCSRLESLRLSELRPLGLCISVEPERFDLGQWVAGHDWEAEAHEETTPSFAAQVQELATQPVPPPTPMWAIDATRSRRGRQ